MNRRISSSALIAILWISVLLGWFPLRAPVSIAGQPAAASAPSVQPSPPADSPSGKLQIYMIDVGQGDSALVIFPDNRTMLIDAGERESAPHIIDLLKRLGIRTLDFLVASHGHPDHTGGLARLIAEGYAGSSTTAFSGAGVWDGIPWHRVKPGDVLYDSAGATVTCYAVGGRVAGGAYVAPERDINARSMVLNIKYRGFDYLSGGDLTGSGNHPNVEDPVGDALARAGVRIDVYKVHHHGSRYSSNLYFLRKIMPEFAMISIGDNNPFGHPTRAALKRLNDPGVHVTRIFQTEGGDGATAPNVTVAHGQIVVATDGVTYRFAGEGPGSSPFSYGPYPVDESAGFWPMFRAPADIPR